MLKILNKFSLFLFSTFLITRSINAQQKTDTVDYNKYLIRPFHDWYEKKTASIKKTYNTVFANKELYLTSSLLLSKQNIDNKNYTSNYIYNYNLINNSSYKPGYSFGLRIENKLIKEQKYSYGVNFNKFSTGTSYTTSRVIDPFLSSYTNYKAEQSFTTANIFFYKKFLLKISDTTKYRFHLTFGPTFHWIISKPSIENSVSNGYYVKSFINGDFGLEFNNKNYYILYTHYRIGSNFINQTIPINLSTYEIGIMLKARDLF